jgi:pimeloyl-ACP methyl ester carboxylesterase
LHFLAAAEKPELYKAIILLDAPVISPLSSVGIKLLKKMNLMEKFSPARVTKFRRSAWQTKEEAFEHFKKKEKFADFDEDVLRDYVEHGTFETENKVKLFFAPRVEAEIYRTIPHNLPNLRGKLKVPAFYIGGTRSREAKWARLGFMRKHFSFQFYFIEGTHLFPLEKPLETAEIIERIILAKEPFK